jgi:hypothetical protein
MRRERNPTSSRNRTPSIQPGALFDAIRGIAIALRFGTDRNNSFSHERPIKSHATNTNEERQMRTAIIKRVGKFTWGLAAMLLGLPIPVVIIAFLARGCS